MRLHDERTGIPERLRRFVEDEVAPQAARLDRENAFPEVITRQLLG